MEKKEKWMNGSQGRRGEREDAKMLKGKEGWMDKGKDKKR